MLDLENMSTYELICQIIGIIAMIISVTSFQMKTKKKIIILQLLTGVVFAVHYFMLPNGLGIAGGVVNVLAIIRNLVLVKTNNNRFWIAFFCVVMGMSAVISRPEPISVLMAIAMVFNTLAIAAKTPTGTRKNILISSPFALVYNIVILSIGGIANESLVEVITFITFIRERDKKSAN